MNNWFVITGSPSSGKTTLIKALEKQGKIVVHETSRILIDSELKRGKKLEELGVDTPAFQLGILQLKIAAESTLVSTETVFLDRGIPDTLAYFRLHNFEDSPLAPLVTTAIKNCWYKKVFFLEPLPYEKGYGRIEDAAEAKKLDALLKKVYANLPFPVVSVPAMSIEKRLDFILSQT